MTTNYSNRLKLDIPHIKSATYCFTGAPLLAVPNQNDQSQRDQNRVILPNMRPFLRNSAYLNTLKSIHPRISHNPKNPAIGNSSHQRLQPAANFFHIRPRVEGGDAEITFAR